MGIMDIRDTLKESIGSALERLGISVAENIPLEHPSELKNGDYSSGVAMQYAKQSKLAPHTLAEKIAEQLRSLTSLGPTSIQRIEVAGAGFINFYLAPSILAEAVDKARTEDMPARRPARSRNAGGSLGAGGWGSGALNKGKKIMVEYTDPNPFKEFHIGHLMSNAIGESIARLLEFSGAEVRRANYQGDVGPHVAKALFVLLERDSTDPTAAEIGAAYAEGARRYEENEADKAAIEELNRAIYRPIIENTRLMDLYERGRKTCLEAFEKLYEILGTKFDYYFFESETAPTGIQVVREHTDVFVKSEGAIVYQGERQGLHTRVFITSKGLPTYEAKELGLARMKAEKWPFDSSISVTAHEQSGYFEVVLAAMREVAPELASKLRHISHGMMRLPSGKMSSRTGDVITGESLLAELVESAKERATDSRAKDTNALAENVAVAAIKYQILKQASGRDIVFDRERALSLEGDSGPYLQYAHARAHAVVEKAREQNIAAKADTSAEPSELSRLLHRFPEAVEYAARELEPHLLTNYLLEFASAFNRWYANEQILDGSASSPHKVALTDAVRRTLKNGLWLLGIPAPEKM